MLRELLVIFGGNIVLLSAVAWLIKKLTTHYLSKDIETYKQVIKSEAEKALIEHDAVFRNMHSKRADAIAELYAGIVQLRVLLNILNNELQDQKNQEELYKVEEEQIIVIISKISEVKETFESRRLYFTKSLAENIDNMLTGCVVISLLGEYSRTGNSDVYTQKIQDVLGKIDDKNISENINKLISMVNDTMTGIEVQFRSLFGVTERVETS